jgi:GntR family phosphonate transport system transcriptional regulator
MSGLVLRRGEGMTLWAQIASAIREDIRGGVFRPGTRLPTEQELAGRFDVNRHTLRRAVAELAAEGLLRVVQGRGTFVPENVVDYRVRKRTRFTDILVEQGRVPGGEVVKTLEMPADRAIGRALRLRRGDPVAMVEILGTADGEPISLAAHYFSARRFPDILRHLRETRSVTKAMARAGVADYTRRTTRVGARMPSADEARRLAIGANVPLIVTEAINVDPDGRPVEFGVSRMVADRVRLVFET